ncbi:sigma-54-dependent Fis family transcriptional regulator [Isoalcanivorax beigongshangi]|uniref:Sigma-54-dependent Fis family transcriptional regulator n=1 Tax=Isoalcanivorax beigongshangi TaxID=3238810 RepID=A0ABV4AJ25_9GAMM
MQIKTTAGDEHRIMRAREVVHADGAVPAGSLRDAIQASWQRSINHGVRMNAGCEINGERRYSSDDLYEANRILVDAAVPVLEQLSGHLRQRPERSLLILANAEARVLAIEGHSSTHPTLRDLAPGVCWSECHRGTNALGTALVEQKPTLIGYGEHFLDRLSPFSCTAVPIRKPDGSVHGVIDLTQMGPLPQPEDWFSLLNLSANYIERRLFSSQYADHLVIAFHPRQQYLDSSWQGLLALDDDGRILALNDPACQLFAQSRDHLVGKRADRLVAGYRDLLKSVRLGGVGTFATPRGSFFYKVLHVRPSPLQAPVARPRVADNSDAREQLQALAGGNSSYATQLRMASRALANGLPILLQGETGSGKEWVARRLHDASPRADKPFVAVNCAAIPETLIESELFGYRDGAFTGARRGGMVGRLQQAHGGTLFLDEVGDMPLALQARLLRVLQERRVAPLGAGEEQELDITLICATHRDLKQLVGTEQFREDLYYRVHGLSVMLPPLRERHDFDALCDTIMATHNDAPPALDEPLATLLRGYHWPGNLRQLDMVLRTALALWEPEDGPLGLMHLPATTRAELENDDQPARGSSIRDSERATIRQAMAVHQGNVSRAAKALDISRATLYRKLKQLES